MRNVFLPLLASLAVATPALADEARLEARGGVYWTEGSTQDVWGLAAGYDHDLGKNTFVGAEVSGDKVGASGQRVFWGFTGRGGIKATENTKLYVSAGYSTKPYAGGEHAWTAGAGVEQGIGNSLYVKGEYRHFFVGSGIADSDAVLAGVGMKF